MQTINIIIYSLLEQSGGGRETWLNLFLPVLKIRTGANVNIYYRTDGGDTPKIDVLKDRSFNFVGIKTPKSTNLLSNCIGLFKFTFKVALNLLAKSPQKNVILCIGSFYETLPVSFYKLCFPFRNMKTYVWLRTIWEYEMKALRINIISNIVLKYEVTFLKKVDLVIANGWDTAAFYQKKHKISSSVLPNAINLSDFKYFPMENKKKSPIIISFIGRISKEKGIEDFLSAINIFNTNCYSLNNQVRFEVVGDGALVKEVEQSKEPNLFYIGSLPHNQMASYLKRVHIAVALTYSNDISPGGGGVSNQLLELMASGVLIVAWKNSAFEQILDSSCAFLCNEKDCNMLADIWGRIVNNYQDTKSFLLNSRSLVERFSIENHVEKFIKIVNL